MKKLSIRSQGLRKRLLIAFLLMSILPLWAMVYITYNLVSPYAPYLERSTLLITSVIALLSIGIAWLGYLLAKGSVDPIIDMSIQSRLATDSNFEHNISIKSDDETGALADSINLMIKRIKDSMVELKEYSSRTKEINIEIQRKIVILNDLLNLCDFISDKTEISKLISMVINKLAGLYVHGFSVAYFEESPGLLKLKCSCNVENGQILRVMDVKRGEDFLGEAVSKKKTIVIDSSTPKASSAFLFKTKFELSNAVIMPVSVMGDIKGLIIVGNNDASYVYTNDDVDIIRLFTKQLSIALENLCLAEKAEALNVVDELTGLYNEKFIMLRLDEEIQRAIAVQKACSLVVIKLLNADSRPDDDASVDNSEILKRTADFLKKAITDPNSIIGKLEGDRFAVILAEKNKKRAMSIVENLKNGILALQLQNVKGKILVRGGVSENPLDGSSASHLMTKALDNIKTNGGMNG